MKLAVTSAGPDLASSIDPRFGRARYLLVVETGDRTVLAIDNQAGISAAQGAGIQAAQAVIDHGVTVLITGHCGPKAFRALAAAGINVYLTNGGTVAEALDRYDAGELALAPAADVDGHW
ncbi:MAG: NifB/NifX family molybdenum-iron cluster-binding protein [Thermoleophilia bacterium]